MREKARGRVYRSAAEKRRFVEQYERSGLSLSEFCRERDLCVTNLQRWRGRAKALKSYQEGSRAKPEFVEVIAESGVSWQIELAFGDGVVLRMRK